MHNCAFLIIFLRLFLTAGTINFPLYFLYFNLILTKYAKMLQLEKREYIKRVAKYEKTSLYSRCKVNSARLSHSTIIT